MDRLPPEILGRISYYTFRKHKYSASALAATCQTIQKAVERYTFSEIMLNDISCRLVTAVVCRFPHRIQALKVIGVTIISFFDKEILRQTIKSIFGFLASLQATRCTSHGGIVFCIHLPGKILDEVWIDFSSLLIQEVPRTASIPHIPNITCVSQFILVDGTNLGFPHYPMYCYLCHIFPNLKVVSWGLDQNGNPGPTSARTPPNLIGSLILIPKSVTIFRVKYSYHKEIYGMRFRSLQMMMPGDADEQLCSALRFASQRFERVAYHNVLGSSQLFWPKSGSALPHWPQLKHFDLTYHICTPPVDQNQSSQPEYDVLTKYEHLNEFYTAVAHAITRMPKLERMRLAVNKRDVCGDKFQIFVFEVEGRTATARWSADPVFIPDRDIIRILDRELYNRDLLLRAEFTSKYNGDFFDNGMEWRYSPY
ncbi:hypothetical protein M426DRAFT_256979 [Hypoxylon sp. CI-4A]|nr:hypothetical protein M426DRAFT_256979 [Hypoxylon sp. CI-4A]